MIGASNRILVQDTGYIPVSSLSDGEYTVWNGTQTSKELVKYVGNGDALEITMYNGQSLVCSPDHLVAANTYKDLSEPFISAKDLTKRYFIRTSEPTFDFDYLDLSSYEFLSRLTTREIGILSGLFYANGTDSITLGIEQNWANAELFSILHKLQEFTKSEVYVQKYKYRYIVSSKIYRELENFLVTSQIPESFWLSKPLIEGFFRGLFTYGEFENSVFSITRDKVLKEFPKLLMLWQIQASYNTKGRFGRLFFSKENCYKFADAIGTCQLPDILEALDLKKILYYNYIDYSKRVTMKYQKIFCITKLQDVSLYQVGNCMVNGVITNG